MKVKLDENLGRRTANLFEAAGHDVATVLVQGLAGATDDRLLEVCDGEGRAMVTLDLDFANPLHYDPATTPGIAVLRVPSLPGRRDLDHAASLLIEHLRAHTLAGHLWVVARGHVRQYEP